VADNRAFGGDALFNEGITFMRNGIIQSPGLGDNPCGGNIPSSDGGMVISAPSFLNNNNATCGLSAATNQLMVTPDELNLGPLDDNGGPTQTHALLAGSVAIDGATQTGTGCPAWDQRGWIRGPVPCDSGAYEFNAGDPDIMLIDGFEAQP
jgi:hypothetical protein